MKESAIEIKKEIKLLRKEIEMINERLGEVDELKQKKRVAVTKVKELRAQYASIK
ncbi:MAG: hypothetical protein ACI9LM_005323 [Alteromonadaceae bacterium]|jgi:hypothetical protein